MISWILGLSAAYAVALNGTMVMPVVVLAMSKLAGYDEGLATVVASAELAGIAIYGIFLPKLAMRSWRLVAIGGLLAVILGEASSFWQQGPFALAAARLVAGLGEGAVFSLISMNLASLANAERLWGVLALIGGVAMGVLLFVVSLMPHQETSAPVFLILAAFMALMAPFFLLMAKRPKFMPVATLQSKLDRPKIILTMLIVFLVYAVQAGQWAICGYVAERVGLSNSEVGLYLAVSSLAGFVGAIIPSMTRDKAKRLPFVVLGFFVMAVSIYYFFNIYTATVFITAQIMVNIGFFIVTPFVTGVLTENDPDGSLMSRILVIAIVGATVGTAIAGPVFETAGPSAVAWACLLPLAVAAMCAIVVFGHLHRGLNVVAKLK
ncbi:putative major facilitator superfamily transporter [Agrobacterium rubi TR3 = NBRC 13261]|uniref:Putative major facilitator superfamily transporter n=1 Tax=Agrobacterium rubi TR3 = NBRC 13261 TaxID=1368415 RepID=A0A081CPK0_9HYPH|nr:MFS transporter [Agrobacterium rubi]MBP1877604.1 putative MFS family arabinose efflux permease [Agrobacterium rubi]MCL6654084.1 MFS transporter permease [Agrobacterium rubi]GAK68596.1 putative major facilitator superfamily transporter [Agrobacterium rubi TR3 = NBRC 13261]